MHVDFPYEISCHPIFLHSSYEKLLPNLLLDYMGILALKSCAKRILLLGDKGRRYSFWNPPLLINEPRLHIFLGLKLALHLINLRGLFGTHYHGVHGLLEYAFGLTINLILLGQLPPLKSFGFSGFIIRLGLLDVGEKRVYGFKSVRHPVCLLLSGWELVLGRWG